MFAKSSLALFVAASISPALGRYLIPERDGRAIYLHPRRFGQEHPAVIDKLAQACPGQVCGVLSGQAISPLLAAAAECAQQDMADQIIDAADQFDNTTKTNMIALAVEYRQAEKNTSPDFTTQPPTLRNSVFCQTAPKNPQLNGFVQAQDPANDAIHFFDPAEGKTVLKGSQANTCPFGTANCVAGSASSTSNSTVASSSVIAVAASTTTAAPDKAAAASSTCPAPVTVTVTTTPCPEPKTITVTQATSTASAAATTTPCPEPKTFTVTSSAVASAASAASSSSTSTTSTSGNIQAFTGALGGVTPPPVTSLGNGQFQVTGNAVFNDLQDALVRSCDVQHNQCANNANATGNKGDVTVDACGTQQQACDTQAQATAASS